MCLETIEGLENEGKIEEALLQKDFIPPFAPEEQHQDVLLKLVLFINTLIATEKELPESLIVYSGTSIITRVYMDLFNAVGKKLQPKDFIHYFLRIPKRNDTSIIWLNTTLFENIWYHSDCTLSYFIGSTHRIHDELRRTQRKQFIKNICKFFSIKLSHENIEKLFHRINDVIDLLKSEFGCSLYQICIPKKLCEETINQNVCFQQHCIQNKPISILSALAQPKTYGHPESLVSFRGVRQKGLDHDPDNPVLRVHATAPYSFIHNNHDKHSD